jgi:hypothetical protein
MNLQEGGGNIDIITLVNTILHEKYEGIER